MGWRWYLVTLGLPILMAGLASYLTVLLGAPAPTAAQLAAWPAIFATFPITLLIPGLGGTWEEPGWRGFALHRLEARRSRLWALLPLWIIIVVWHIPLFLTSDAQWVDAVNMVGGVIIYNWLYHRSGQSVLLVMMMMMMIISICINSQQQEKRMNTLSAFLKRDAKVTFFTLSFAITFLLFERGDYIDAARIPFLFVVQQDEHGERTKPLRANGTTLDVHTHIASQALTDLFTGGGVPAASADDLIAKLDEGHVKRAIILSAAYIGSSAGIMDDFNVIPEKYYVASQVAKYPNRLIGLCGINPVSAARWLSLNRV